MSDLLDKTPPALYARFSSYKQDVKLSVAAQLRALRDYVCSNGYLVVREYIDEAESGCVADRPKFRKMLDDAGLTDAPSRRFWSGSSPASLASGSFVGAVSRWSPSRACRRHTHW